jgi:nitrogen regulatory protein PII
MNIKRITTIIPTGYLDKFEGCLRAAGVPGMTIDNVKGFGEHANYFSRDLLRSNVRIEVYIPEERCDEVCETIIRFAAESPITAGILTIESIEHLIDLNTGKDALIGNPGTANREG